ncbi:hypothetical protein evm_015208, partial [Chilo suppressalis]
ICDAKLKILYVNALFPGSTHDSYIWNNSQVLTLMEQLHRTGHQNYHLIGDSGYGLRPWILTPLSNPPEGTAEHRYNEAFKTTLATVETLNGVLKARFRCLLKDRVLHYKSSTATIVIYYTRVESSFLTACSIWMTEQAKDSKVESRAQRVILN